MRQYVDAREARSIGLLGNAAEILPEIVRRGFGPQLVTDQTSAHDEYNGYIPAGLSLAEAAALRAGPARGLCAARALPPWRTHVEAMLEFQRRGAVAFDYGNNIRAQAQRAGCRERLRLSGLRARLHPAPLLQGHRPLPLGGALRRSGGHRRHGSPP